MANCIMCGKSVYNYPGYVTDGVIHVCNDCASSNSLMRVMTRIENRGLSANLKSVFFQPIETSLVNQTSKRVELDKSKLDTNSSLVNQTKADNDYPDGFSLPAAVNHLYDECEQVWLNTHSKAEVHSRFIARVKELEAYTGKSADEMGINEPDMEYANVQGYMPNCPFLPCNNCRFFYGELYSCMVGEEGVNPTEEELDKVREALGEEAARDFFAPLKPIGVMGDIENMSQDDFYSKYADNQAALNMWHDYHGESSEFLEV